MDQGVTQVTGYFPSASRWYNFHTVSIKAKLQIHFRLFSGSKRAKFIIILNAEHIMELQYHVIVKIQTQLCKLTLQLDLIPRYHYNRS